MKYGPEKNSVNNNGKNEQLLVKTFFVSLFLRSTKDDVKLDLELFKIIL